MNYLFYDLETTGLCESFDQIVRFAAILSNENLEVIDRYEISIQLRPDVVPSPYALIVTRLGIDDITSGVSEYDALKQIHNIFNKPKQINLGYNSLNFDNNMLRFGFYRNLLDPYSHQYKNNAFRADVMNINLLYYLYKNDVISWPDIGPMKLENINAYNNLFDGKSHDAMVDVEVTIELARLLRNHDKRMWDYLISGFIKNNDISRMNKLTDIDIGASSYKLGVFTDISLGYESKCCCAALCIGKHQTYKNQSLWMKMDYPDVSNYFNDADSQPRILKRKDSEPSFILPWEKSYNYILGDSRIKNVEDNINWLNENPSMLNNFISDSITNKYDEVENLDIDASIYTDGLFKSHELSDINIFHDSNMESKISLICSMDNQRISHLASRIIFRNFSSHLSIDLKEKIKNEIICTDYISLKGKSRRTPEEAMEESKSILTTEDIDSEQIKILNDYIEYLT